MRLIYRARNLSFEHFPRGVVNIFAIYMSILRSIRDSIFFLLGRHVFEYENYRVNKNPR